MTVLSFEDVIVQSSNVGAIKVGLRLGPRAADRLRPALWFRPAHRRPTSAARARAGWDPLKLDDSALASVSMGHQVGVTPLQMAAAVSAVANGGELVEPRLVRAVIREGTRIPVPRTVLGRSISEGTAAQLTR
jgi:cell division protein FtsI/penicillin-binding protein 2